MGTFSSALPRAVAVAGALLALAPAAGAQTPEQLRRAVAAVGVEERLGAAVPRDLALAAEDGRVVTLRGLAGTPVLLTFNYTGCQRLCGVQLGGLARALRESGWDGRRFSVLTVSIDPAETLAQLRRYKETFVRQAGGGDIARAWTFARGTAADVEALAGAVGFRYRYDPASGQFAHQATVVVLGVDGRVSGYLHGVTYAQESLRAALARAEAGRVATADEQASLGGFLLTCIGFGPDDPLPLALKIMRAAGGAAALFLVGFVAVTAARDARRRRAREAQ